MTDTPNRFIIRVYGIALNQRGELLLSEEFRIGKYMTKFVGGGLEFGEGVQDCLHREFMEECGVEIKTGRLLHINSHFQESAFHPRGQLISIYFSVQLLQPIPGTEVLPPRPWQDGDQYFRWADPVKLRENELTWPVDRDVIRLIKAGSLRD
jgi:8-oxo-dGTP diphosphatase